MKTIESDTSIDSCSFSLLPDDIILGILSKLINLRTLCFCKLVSKRFYRIVSQVDSISFSYRRQLSQLGFRKRLLRFLKKGVGFKLFSTGFASSRPYTPSDWNSIVPAFISMEKFKRLKSLCIELPSFFKNDFVLDKGVLFKWEIKFSNNALSFIFLSPTAICYSNSGNHQEEEEDTLLSRKKFFIAKICWFDAKSTFNTLFGFTIFPLLEKLSITESSKRGKISISGENIAQLRKRLNYSLDSRYRVSKCYIPLLELPVSGCMMKGVTLYFLDLNDRPYGDDSFRKSDLDYVYFEDKDEVSAYNEAVMEIFKNHRGRIEKSH